MTSWANELIEGASGLDREPNKETHVKKECEECFDWFVTYSGRQYCNTCTAHIVKTITDDITAELTRRKEKLQRERMERREKACATRKVSHEW